LPKLPAELARFVIIAAPLVEKLFAVSSLFGSN
jgi:hypothetical protein